MTSRPYLEVDVFGSAPFLGNPLAVVLDGQGLDDAALQGFARWTNLSETTFLLPARGPQADYRVRIFTPASELPFAGHPTLGSCHAWLAAGGRPRHGDTIVQECGVGLVTLRRQGQQLAFAAPPLTRAEVDVQLLERVLAALRLPRTAVRGAQWIVNGPRWLGLLLDQAATVLALEPDHGALARLALVGVIGPHAPAPDGTATADFEVRAFTAAENIIEDPVTGSLNAAFAQWLIAEGLAPARYVASQGARIGRAGLVAISAEAGSVWVGGRCATCVEGSVYL
jgi:PhzF family phenazine biosynthesis protein